MEAAELEVLVNTEGLLVMPLLQEDEVHIILEIPPYMVPAMLRVMGRRVEQQILCLEALVEPRLHR